MSGKGGETPLLRDRSDIRDALAAEYALGALHGAARRRFERWVVRDEDLRCRVRAWDGRLAEQVKDVEPVAPPEGVWRRVRYRIRGERSLAQRLDSLWNSLPLWRGVALVAILLLALTVGWSLRPGVQSPLPERLAVVSGQKVDPIWVIAVGEHAREIRIRTLREAPMGAGQVCPLWLRGKDDQEIRMLGLLPREKGVYTLQLPPNAAFMERGELIVSVEPADQIPKDRPSGPIMYRGDWIQL